MSAIVNFPRCQSLSVALLSGTCKFLLKIVLTLCLLEDPCQSSSDNRGPKTLQAFEKVPNSHWTDTTVDAFASFKLFLVSGTLLSHIQPGELAASMADMSSTAIGTALQQCFGTDWKPLAFLLKLAETKSSTYGRELLAAYLAVNHFRHFLDDHEFSIITYVFHSDSTHHSPREIWHLAFLARSSTGI